MCTTAAQRELVSVGALAVLSPVVVGFLLQQEALGGFLAGVILSGQLMAVFMANAGGAWDNAKKTIEDGHYGGKGSEAHKAAIVGDTVGDPLKDTSGPALNPMIKVINLVSLLLTPLVVQVSYSIKTKGWFSSGVIPYLVVCLACLVIMGWAYIHSKKESFSAATAGK
jgi:K(+)-stimulated pyrophosphate-energized sodium pump